MITVYPPAASLVGVWVLVKNATGMPTALFTTEKLPLRWADYPGGYSVFETSLDIHTGRYHIAIYYKGSRCGDRLKSAQKVLTNAGLACEYVPRAGKSRDRVIVTGRL